MRLPELLGGDLERGNEPPCYETVCQWAKQRRQGIILETISMGRRKYTLRQAFTRFFDGLGESKKAPDRLPGQVDVERAAENLRYMKEKHSVHVPK